jgi:MFS family permease
MTDSSQTPASRRDPYAALRSPSYRLFAIGWFIALVGTRIQSVAVAWDMYQRTGEALSLGLVGLAQAVPTMLLALPAGYLADRFNRPRLVIFSQLASVCTALALGVLSYLHGPTSWIYLLLLLDATAVILGRPARVALMPQLVPAQDFPNAVTWNTSMIHISSVVGPAIGGLVIQLGGSLAYVLSALGAISFALLLMFIRFEGEVRRAGTASWQNFVAGAQYVWQERIILVIISLDMFAVLLGGATYLLPIYASDILRVDSTGFGWLRAAPAVGAMCMAFLMLYLPPMQRAGWTLLLAVAGFGVATIVFGLSTSFWLSLSMLFLTGAFDNISMVIRQTLQQLLTPAEMRGRVSAVSSVFISASNELGGLESGLVAHWYGPLIAVVSGGIGTLVVVAITALVSPQLRSFGVLYEAKPTLKENRNAVAKPAAAG